MMNSKCFKYNEDNIISILENFFNKNNSVSDYCEMDAVIKKNMEALYENDTFRIGYKALGPVLFGFIRYLCTRLEREKIKKVFFLARDGQLIQRAFKILNPNKHINDRYLFASRRALIVPTLWMCSSFDEVVNSMYFPKRGTIDSFLAKLGLDSLAYCKLAEESGFEMGKQYYYSDLFLNKKFVEFVSTIMVDVKKNSFNEYNMYVSYLKRVGFTGKVAVVDIGWHGNMQKALQHICDKANINVEIFGYYVGVNPKASIANNIKISGFLFDSVHTPELHDLEELFNDMFETLFMADHGSVERLIMDRGKIIPVFKQFEFLNRNKEYADEYLVIKEIQDGAVQFIRDMNSSANITVNWTSSVCFQNMLSLGLYPTYTEATIIGNILFMDDSISFLAKPKTYSFYLLHPLNFFYDLRNAPWRIGFLTRFFYFSIPYYKILLQAKGIIKCLGIRI